jgi:hypothetical protein
LDNVAAPRRGAHHLAFRFGVAGRMFPWTMGIFTVELVGTTGKVDIKRPRVGQLRGPRSNSHARDEK